MTKISKEVIGLSENTTSKTSIESSNELSHKVIDISKDMIKYINEDKKNVVDSSKEYYSKLIKMKESTHKAQIETVYYRIIDETLSEISKNVLTYAESIKYIKKKLNI